MQETTEMPRMIRRLFWRAVRIGVPIALVAGLAYWFNFAPMPVEEQLIKRGEIIAEVMGTGTLEARVKTTVNLSFSGSLSRLAWSTRRPPYSFFHR